MKKGIPPLVIANWKMNPQTVTLSQRLGIELKKKLQKILDVDIVIAPPTIYLESMYRICAGGKSFTLGAQNVHHESLGAHTGEVSVPMLQNFGVSHIILGHSERRAGGEIDEVVNKKLLTVLKAGLVGVVCVGERKRDHAGHYLNLVEIQIRKALAALTKARLSNVVIAYEPIWAIGTGNTATAEDIHEMKIFIEKVLSDMYGRNLAQKIRIIYGGSVNPKNAQELFTEGMVDGFLVGGASLHAEDFTQIVKSVL